MAFRRPLLYGANMLLFLAVMSLLLFIPLSLVGLILLIGFIKGGPSWR